MSPGKPRVGKNPKMGINAKNKQGTSRVSLSKENLAEIRLRRLRKKLGQK